MKHLLQTQLLAILQTSSPNWVSLDIIEDYFHDLDIYNLMTEVVDKDLIDVRLNGGRTYYRYNEPCQFEMIYVLREVRKEDIAMKIEVSQPINQHITAILENMNDAFYILNEEDKFIYVNPSAELLLQRSKNELFGNIIWDMFTGVKELLAD